MARATMDLLKRSDLLSGLTDEQLARVAALAEPARFDEGAVIVEEDHKSKRCHLLTAGRVDIEVRPPFDGKQPQRIAQLKPGDVFGELSLVDGFLHSASARAAEPVETLAFDNARLEALLAADTTIGYRVMRNIANILATRMRTTNMKLRNALSDALYY